MKQIFSSKAVVIIGILLAVIVLMLGSFATGLKVGLRKAKFSYQWGENYERNFVGPHGGGMMGREERGFGGRMMGGFDGRDFRNSYGVSGTIMSITDNSLVVKDRDEKENNVAVAETTLIKEFRNTVKLSELQTGDQVVVMGKPGDNGVIQATLIRVFPAPVSPQASNQQSAQQSQQ